MGKTKNPYLQILQESLINFDKMTVHKGPVDDVVSYDGKGELNHHEPKKDVVSILERMYFQEDTDENTEPVGWGAGRDKDAENSESEEQDLGDLGTTTGEGNSSEAGSGGAGVLPNGSQPEGSAANAMDANDATSASRETAEVFQESVALFEDVLEEMEAMPNVETGENEPQGSSAIDGDTPTLGDYETETDYTGGEDKNTAENLAPKSESLEEALFEDGLFEGDDEEGGTAVLPKPDATVGDDDSELFSAEDDGDSMEPTAQEMGMYEDDDEDDDDNASMQSEPASGEEEPSEDDEPLEVPAAGGDADDESPEDMAEYGSYEMGMGYESDDTGQDPGGSGMRPGANPGGSGDGTDDQDNMGSEDSEGYDPMSEADEEPVGDTDMDLPDTNDSGVGAEPSHSEDDAPNVEMGYESLFEDDDTDDPNKFAGAKRDPGHFYHMEEAGDSDDEPADIVTDNGASIKPESPSSDETGDAKMENVIVARKQVEESIVERLIREMQSYQDLPENSVKESFDDLDDMDLEDMFD